MHEDGQAHAPWTQSANATVPAATPARALAPQPRARSSIASSMTAPPTTTHPNPALRLPQKAEPLSPFTKPRFTLEAGILAAPRVRQRMGPLLHGWLAGQSRRTKTSSLLDLHQFAAFVLAEDLPPLEERDNTRAATVMLGLLRVRAAHAAVSGFIESLKAQYSAASTIRKVKTLRLWARYLCEKRAVTRHLDDFPIPTRASLEGITASPSNPQNAPTPAPPPSPHEGASIEHLSAEGRAHARQVLEARNLAIVDLLLHSSLDPIQLLDLDWGDIDFGKRPRGDEVLLPPVRIKVPRRDGREYWRSLVPHATHTMRSWNNAYISHFCAALPDRPVFPTIAGSRLSPSRLYEIVEGSRAAVKVAALKPQQEPAAAST